MAGLMKPPPIPKSKPSLITPSASPPPYRYTSQKHATTTKTGTATPAPTQALGSVPPGYKRSSVSSTPKPTQSRASHSSWKTPEDVLVDFHKERQASTQRLLDVWSQLAERYTRRLDEDDIVDIVSGRIIKDNGILRKAKKVQFGDNQVPEKGDEAEEAEGDEEDIGDEDEEDELDAFNEVEAGEEDAELVELSRVRPVPPVAPLDPHDAADLQEFLETERLRRQDLGSEPEDDPEEVTIPDDEGTDAYETAGSEVNSDVYDVDENDTGYVEVQNGHRNPARPVLHDSDSEDELNFNLTETDIGATALQDDDEPSYYSLSDSDDEVEIIELPLPPKIKVLQKLKESSKLEQAKPPTQQQLQTPPLSRTSLSSQPSFPTPQDDCFFTPPPQRTPEVNISPEIPFAHSISKRSLPVSSSPIVPTVKSQRNALTLQPGKSSAGPSTTNPPSPKRKLIPEVVLSRRTPLRQEFTSPSLSEPTSKAIKASLPSIKVKRSTPCLRRENPSRDAIDLEEGAASSQVGRALQKPAGKSKIPRASLLKTKKVPASAKSPKDDGSPSTEDIGEPASSSPRKRKRSAAASVPPVEAAPQHVPEQNVASSSKIQLPRSIEAAWSDNESPVRSKDARTTIQQSSPRKRKLRSQTQPSNEEEEPTSPKQHEPVSLNPYQHFYSQQPPPPPNGMYGYPFRYPPPQMMNGTPQHHAHDPLRAYTPMPEPHTQYIVSQVMSHLSALATGHWNLQAAPPPFTPSHQRINAEYAYSTPTHHHQGYPYPMYHPDFSRATAPPDTPEQSVSATPPVPGPSRSGSGHGSGSGGGGAGQSRRKSLVQRSRSRGRTVSFQPSRSQTPEQDRSDSREDDEDVDMYSSPLKAKPSSRGDREREKHTWTSASDVRRRDSSSVSHKGKGKARQLEDLEEDQREGGEEHRMVDEREDEDDRPSSGSRGRTIGRGQTPGPATKFRCETQASEERTNAKGQPETRKGYTKYYQTY